MPRRKHEQEDGSERVLLFSEGPGLAEACDTSGQWVQADMWLLLPLLEAPQGDPPEVYV